MTGNRTRDALPVGVVVGAAIALWLATGVKPDQIVRYLGYELAFVIGPGWLLFRAISPGTRSLLTQIGIGWPLGLVAEIAFFSLTAALDVRDLFYAYPAIVGASVALVWWHSSRAGRTPPPARPEARPLPSPDDQRSSGRHHTVFNPAQRWTIAGLCLAAFAYVGLTLFAQAPIPGSVPNVLYVEDLLFHISVAAEAQQHWPVQTPQVSGVILHYHYFAHLHLAAAGQVTGIDLPIVGLRLYLLPLISLLLLQLALLGRAVSGISWAGPVSVALVLLIWELDLVTPELAPFLGISQILLWGSPSYLLGLVLFVPLITLFAGLLEPAILARVSPALGRRAAWAIIVVLALGAGGAKVVALPLVGAGLFACAAFVWLRSHTFERTALTGLAVCIAVFLAAVIVLYGTSGGGMRLGIGGNYELMPSLLFIRDSIPDSLPAEIAFWGIGSILGTLLLLGPPLLGLVWYFRLGGKLGKVEAFLIGMTVTGVLAFIFLEHDVGASLYFMFYGVVAAAPLSASGLCRRLGGWLSGLEGPRLPGFLLIGGWIIAISGVVYTAWQLWMDAHLLRAYALAYTALLLGLLLIVLWALRGPPDRRPQRVAVAILIVVITAGLDLVYDTVPETVRKLANDQRLYDEVSYGMKRGVYEGAVWARDHLDDDAVLTISNQRSARSRERAPLNTEFPAFSERRAFNEGWAFAIKSSTIDRYEVVFGDAHPYPSRRRLESRLFYRADPEALRTMMEGFGVTHLVVDRVDGAVNPRVYDFGRVVYSNEVLDIIELMAPGPA